MIVFLSLFSAYFTNNCPLIVFLSIILSSFDRQSSYYCISQYYSQLIWQKIFLLLYFSVLFSAHLTENCPIIVFLSIILSLFDRQLSCYCFSQYYSQLIWQTIVLWLYFSVLFSAYLTDNFPVIVYFSILFSAYLTDNCPIIVFLSIILSVFDRQLSYYCISQYYSQRIWQTIVLLLYFSVLVSAHLTDNCRVIIVFFSIILSSFDRQFSCDCISQYYSQHIWQIIVLLFYFSVLFSAHLTKNCPIIVFLSIILSLFDRQFSCYCISQYYSQFIWQTIVLLLYFSVLLLAHLTDNCPVIVFLSIILGSFDRQFSCYCFSQYHSQLIWKTIVLLLYFSSIILSSFQFDRQLSCYFISQYYSQLIWQTIVLLLYLSVLFSVCLSNNCPVIVFVSIILKIFDR